jgi:hypothetical protein
MNREGSMGDQKSTGFDKMRNLLPYGDTLHYPSCGCPQGWKGSTRAADIVDALSQRAFQSYQTGKLVATRPLRVLYFLPHHNVTGGMKCLVEHVRLLKSRGAVL